MSEGRGRLETITSASSERGALLSGRLLEAVFDNATVALFVMDEHQRCIFLNPAAEKLTGFTLAEVQGRPLHDVIHHTRPDGSPYPLAECPIDRAFPEDRREQGEETFVHKDGSFYPVAYTASLIREEGRVVGTVLEVREIAAEKQSERRLRVQFQVARTLATAETLEEVGWQLLPAVCECLDWEVGAFWRVEGEMLRCAEVWTHPSVRAPNFVARTLEEPLPKGVGLPGRIWERGEPAWVLDAATARNFPRVRAAKQEGLHAAFGFPILIEDETVAVAEFFSEHVREPDEELLEVMAALGRQIGQFVRRRRSEEALRESETRFRLVAETASDAILNIDASSTILFANPAAERIFGYRPDELRGRNLTMLMPEYLRHLHRAGLERYLETGRRHLSWEALELPGLHRSGRTIPLEVSFGEYVQGSSHYFTGVIRDVSERNEAQRVVAEARDQLEDEVERRTAELRALTEELEAFNYSVSHDLRAPLRGIDGFSQLLLDDYGDRLDESGRRYLERVRAGANRMGSLIDDLLELSRLTRSDLRPREVDLSRLASGIVEDLRGPALGREVEVDIQADLKVWGDEALLRIVLVNLLENAWKFTRDVPLGRIELAAESRGGETVIVVRDNGAGFDMRYADKLFLPFQRLHSPSEYEGTGIGLATVKRIIHRHGGSIWAESEPGEGATFYFTLPPVPLESSPG